MTILMSTSAVVSAGMQCVRSLYLGGHLTTSAVDKLY